MAQKAIKYSASYCINALHSRVAILRELLFICDLDQHSAVLIFDTIKISNLIALLWTSCIMYINIHTNPIDIITIRLVCVLFIQ